MLKVQLIKIQSTSKNVLTLHYYKMNQYGYSEDFNHSYRNCDLCQQEPCQPKKEMPFDLEALLKEKGSH